MIRIEKRIIQNLKIHNRRSRQFKNQKSKLKICALRNNSKLKIAQSAQFKTQNSKLRLRQAQQFKIQNSKFKTR